MKYVTCRVPDKTCYVLVIGDCHIGDKSFNEESLTKLKGYIKWVKENKNSVVVFNGDILNVATRKSATSPFEQTMDLNEQIEFSVDLFNPIKDKIIAATDGNHELRIKDFTGYSPTISLCERLGMEYLGNSGIVEFLVGKANKGGNRKNEARQSYVGYFHHTTGGGSTVGGKMNRVEKMLSLVQGADFYCGSHNHMLGAVPVIRPLINKINKTIINQKIFLVSCGGYLTWDGSYAEAKQLPATKMGSPRIRLSGTDKKDVHVSL